jgi:hypothetical protein
MRLTANILAFVVCIGNVRIAAGHYLWLKENLEGDAVVTFGEAPGVPGPWAFLSMVADKTSLSSHDVRGQQNVTLSANKTWPAGAMHSELSGHIAATPPFSLRLAATFGIFHGGSLLQYWSSADVVTKPNDWFAVQDWAPQRGLEITIRDPWMNRSSLSRADDAIAERLKLMDPGDECRAHGGPMQDGAACVLAVIRFNGQLIGADLAVDTYTAQGAKLNTTHSQSGVTILKVPYDTSANFTAVWARVNYHENVSGTFEGKRYNFVDHWATTYARIVRAHSDAHELLVI